MIQFKQVTKKYGDTVAVSDVDMHIEANEFVVFIGLSGSGKTTSLSMINRMVEPTSGQIFIDGIDHQTIDPVTLRRNIGYVIQGIGLLPHYTIYENIITVPKLLGWSESDMRVRAETLIELIDLPLETLEEYPNQLSGGQQQRIGVARALAANPPVILMDEPFGALDPITRDALQDSLLELKARDQRTFVFVTHDVDEAFKLADKIAIWQYGELVQFDTPQNILLEPANDYVVELVGIQRIESARLAALTVADLASKDAVNGHKSSVTYPADALVSESMRSMLLDEASLFPVLDAKGQEISYVSKEAILDYYDAMHAAGKQVTV
ncbi:glycine/betaine ABC transporter ATP-binding protein [Suicoccus acidiformans]|uniref:ABC-type quaternary amine transporter n=1 Tax=Suicoccus acidiformans TaxID=2036206 RepID=A0A347WK21_9LACT|nr:ABC transporter ATP-binding protein [Suicoccus acidiformans]AXY25428.1 glycine/betaine ABC transporter ATP-binding protein [Suicoccus acidiformans]